MAEYDVDTHMEVMEEEHREAIAELTAEIADKEAKIAEQAALIEKLQASNAEK